MLTTINQIISTYSTISTYTVATLSNSIIKKSIFINLKPIQSWYELLSIFVPLLGIIVTIIVTYISKEREIKQLKLRIEEQKQNYHKQNIKLMIDITENIKALLSDLYYWSIKSHDNNIKNKSDGYLDEKYFCDLSNKISEMQIEVCTYFGASVYEEIWNIRNDYKEYGYYYCYDDKRTVNYNIITNIVNKCMKEINRINNE